MRLTCPNCAARYEVADGMIAPGGQHVQCTACHTRWYARPPADVAQLAEEAIIARLEARGGRGPRPGSGDPGGDRQQQGNDDFVWEGREAAEEPRRAGPHLRLVGEAQAGPETAVQEPDTRPSALAEADAESSPGNPEAADSRGSKTNEAARPSGARLDLMRAADPDEPTAPPDAKRRRGIGILVAAAVLLVLLAGSYFAADDLADALGFGTVTEGGS